jgi:hypothetical protein
MLSFNNTFAKLCHHRTSVRGVIQDYVLMFNERQLVLEEIVAKTTELVKQLIDSFFHGNHCVLGRLVAKVNYVHFNAITNDEEIRAYHFPSYSAEEIENVDEFFVKHMTKIASRMDSFHSHGSNLVIKNIEHIHIQLTVKK